MLGKILLVIVKIKFSKLLELENLIEPNLSKFEAIKHNFKS